MMQRIVVTASILFAVSAARDLKLWKRYTNLGEPNNWLDGKLPCATQSVRLPEHSPDPSDPSVQSPMAYWVDKDLSIKEMILPSNGHLYFGEYISVDFGGRDINCKGQVARFIATEQESWYSPNNWCVINNLEDPCPTQSELPERLHTEQVPCNKDSVSFSRDSTFLVNLTAVQVELHDIHIGQDVFYSAANFRRYMDEIPGSLMLKYQKTDFVRELEIDIKPDVCQDARGCECGNDEPETRRTICDYIDCSANIIDCDKPFTPAGHCCEVCGGMLNMTVSGSFNMERTKTFIQNTYLATGVVNRMLLDSTKVVQIASRLSAQLSAEPTIQFLFLDNIDGSKAASVAERVFHEINREKYGIIGISYTHSVEEPSTGGQASSISNGGIAGLVIGILCVVVIILIVSFFLYKRNSQHPLSLKALFTKTGDDTGIEMNVPKSSQGFTNPCYDSPNPYSSIEAIDYEPKTGSFDNPLYNPIDSPYQDPTKGEALLLDLGATGHGAP